MIPKYYHDFFQETYNGIPQWCFHKQVGNELGKVQIGHMESKFLGQLNNSPQYSKLRNFDGFLKWFECKISNVVTNLS
jgi:hypothetical protein